MIEIKQVSKWYGDFQVLDGCSTTVGRGEVVVVCGPSGSGKSTLLKTVNALEPFQQGEVVVNGMSLSRRLRPGRNRAMNSKGLMPNMRRLRHLPMSCCKSTAPARRNFPVQMLPVCGSFTG